MNAFAAGTTAGERDPVRAAVADHSHTRACLHPKPSTLPALHCSICEVFILDGRVLDVGKAREQLRMLRSPAIDQLISAAKLLERAAGSGEQREAIQAVLGSLELVELEESKRSKV